MRSSIGQVIVVVFLLKAETIRHRFLGIQKQRRVTNTDKDALDLKARH